MLCFDGVTLRQGAFTLTADWDVPAGITTVIGPSGSGKSTLLSAVAGFLEPAEGCICLRGRSLTGLSPARRPVAMLFQDHNLFPHLTLAQNVGLGLAPRLRLTKGQSERVADVLARVGLQEAADRRPGEVSGGQQNRAALARALVQDRTVVCLDEPFSALGPGQRQDMLTLVAEVLADRVVLLVTHYPEEARGVAARGIFVEGGIAATPVPFDALMSDPPAALASYLRRRP